MKNSQFEFINLITEERNSRTNNLDVLSTVDLVSTIQNEDSQIIEAVKQAVPQIAAGVDVIVEGLRAGGRLLYFGAGTSGRLGILDASECPPTFGVTYDLVKGYIAGGRNAVFEAVEGAEDKIELGEQDVQNAGVKSNDIVCGITASGRTPYVIGALRKAKELKAATISITNNQSSNAAALADLSDVFISAVTGPEALTGSTRMKAGTAQKMVLNLLTTSAMIKLGKAYENLMVDVVPSNHKLRQRAVSIIATICSVQADEAKSALEAAGNKVKTAIVMIKKKLNCAQAQELLAQSNDSLRNALEDKK